jgi:hypothetical protein
MQLKCLNCLSHTLNTHVGMQTFLSASNSTFNSYSRLIASVKELKLSSRLTVSISTILSRVSFHETLNLFAIKCHKKLMLNPNSSYDTDFITDIVKVMEFIFIYIYRCLQVENATDNNDLILTETETNNNFGSNLNLNYSFNRIPLQNLFNKYSFLVNKSNSTIQFRHLLGQLDHFQFFTNLILLWSHMQDQLIYLHQNADFLYLSKLIELLLNELFVSSRNITNRQLALDYLLTNMRLTKCIFTVMLAPNATKLAQNFINSKLNLAEIVKHRFYSPSVLYMSIYLKLAQLSDKLEFNLSRIKPLVNSYNHREPINVSNLSNYILNTVLDSANIIQSINFLLNIESVIGNGKYF